MRLSMDIVVSLLAAGTVVVTACGSPTGVSSAVTDGSVEARIRTPEEAKRLLELAADAMSNIQTLSADIEVGATETYAQFLPSAKGRLIVARMSEVGGAVKQNPFEFRFTGKGKISDPKPELAFDAIYRERRYEWMNDTDKQQRIRFERIAGRDDEVRLAKGFYLDELFTREPLAVQIRSEGLELVEAKEFDGLMCEGVKVPVGTGGRYVIYYIPRSDFIPRRIVQSTSASVAISGVLYKDLKNVKVDAVLPAGAFEMAIPEGYTPDPNPARVSAQANPRATYNESIPTPKPRRPLAAPFELEDAGGATVALGDLRGRVVVLDFWGTWLPDSARQGMGVMQSLSEHFSDKPVDFYGLNFRERDPEKAISFFKDGGFTYKVLLNADEVWRRYGVRQFPTMYIIGFDGEVVDVVNGFKKEATLRAMTETIETYLSEQAGENESADGDPTGG